MKGQHFYSYQVEELFKKQLHEWSFLKLNYNAIGQIRLKNLEYPDYYLRVQFNPARIVSSSAKIDKTTIENRSCFLCENNRPAEQRYIQFSDDFQILINPFPIFPNHLTITISKHEPQLIKNHFNSLLLLAGALPDYTVFYNGPRCGASAPDHFHFQAGSKNYMPLDYQIDRIKKIFGMKTRSGTIEIWKINDLLRKFFLLESALEKEIETVFYEIYDMLSNLKPMEGEPDVNLHCSFQQDKWRLLIFPRRVHRPWQYSAEGEDNILFSPASVDLGGLLVVPLEKDFERMDKVQAWSMLRQVCLSTEDFNAITI